MAALIRCNYFNLKAAVIIYIYTYIKICLSTFYLLKVCVFYFILFYLLFRTTRVAYGSSQARDP